MSNKCSVKTALSENFPKRAVCYFDLCGFCYGRFARFQYIMLSVMLAQEYALMYSP